MGDLWDAIEGKPQGVSSHPFWTVFYKTKNGKTKIVEIQAENIETAFAKAEIHYPDSPRTLISL